MPIRRSAGPPGLRQATVVGDTKVPQGAEVWLLWGAEETGADHAGPLAFGHGPHACPAADLARAQIRIASETIIETLGDPRLDPDACDLSNVETGRDPWSAPRMRSPRRLAIGFDRAS